MAHAFRVFKQILINWISRVELISFQLKWRERNKNNRTSAENTFPVEKVTVGDHSYGPLNVISFGHPDERLQIGNYCSIAKNVKFLLSGEHNYRRFSTYPFDKILGSGKVECECRGAIILEDDVWIGYGCIILSGCRIGKGAVIGAGSIVAKDIPPYTVYVGNKVLKQRFSERVINRLYEVDYKSISVENIVKNYSILAEPVTDDNLEKLVSLLERVEEKSDNEENNQEQHYPQLS